MLLIIIIAFISLIGLLVLHEFGHFVLAKKFGVPVDEFGVGYPPRLFGKKFRGTFYSLNLLPFGAFVKIRGEEGGLEDIRSFGKKPIWQRVLIVLGGVVAFWLIAWVILSFVIVIGTPTAVLDEENHNLINPRVAIAAVAPGSPAEKAGLKPGDTIASLKLKTKNEKPAPYRNEVFGSGLKITKAKEVIGFINLHRGEEITLTIEREEEPFDVSLVPRVSPPEGEGAMGVALTRLAIYPWYEAPIQGAISTVNLTFAAIDGWIRIILGLFRGQGMPAGVQIMGPVGIFDLFVKMSSLGVGYYLRLIAIVSIFLALFNLLPIPALDGGKLVFLGIEAVRKKPVSPKIEQNITAFFFALLVILMLFVTFKDIQRLL